MKAIINTEDELIKSYLKVRKELIENFKNTNLRRESIIISWLQQVEINGNIDSLLYDYDQKLLLDKLSKKSKKLFDEYDPVVIIVTDDFIIYEHRYGMVSFKTKDDRYNWLKQYSDDNYDAFKDFSQIDLKEIKGNIDNNTEQIIEDSENGIITFIKASSIFSENIIVGYKK